MKIQRIHGVLTAVASEIDESGHQWIEVMPACGKAQNGQHRFEVTAADLEVFAADIRARGDRVSIDYDHSYIAGGSTLAAGWFTNEARVEGDKLMARVRWTPQAVEQIKTGQFRFISPEWSMQEKGADGYWRKAKEFLAATLTNRPYFKNLAAVGSEDDDPGGKPASNEGDNMRDALIASLGLPKDATDDQITAKLAEVKENADKATELEAEVTTLKAAAEATPTDDEEREKLLADAKAGADAKEELRVMRRDTLISAAIADRKIDPAEKDKYVGLYDAAPDATAALIAGLKAGKLGALGSEHDTPEGGSAPLAAGISNGDALTGTHVPESVSIKGTDYPVDEESAKVHVAALALLEEAGKRLTFTEDEYTAAAIAAADKQGIRL